MGTIFSSKKTDPGNERAISEGIQESIYPFYHEVNITDGGEFLDDAIRMKDQPLGETKDREN
ncbi:hypothetical protein [Agriterribacter sp.]|uniref:hypothetical protein n=1 Tax=Agriterribacter sp. TaxID=2821509 RepID=UPI002C1A3A28|nr:hypothetical protein [Agriterribacter sp.]HRO44365.1 hypothetical protein [Agriterribacter sp.]HRQ16681.1 hypothetical protein [Agriterribacter sp.]